jgi:hypothetical protein
MSDLSDELVEAARQIVSLVEAERMHGDGDVPPPPNVPSAEKEIAQLHYKGLIDDAASRLKAALDERVATRKREEDRADTSTSHDFEREKVATAAEVAREVAAQAVADARLTADIAAEVALVKSVHDAYIAVAQGAIDRAMKRAEFVTATVTAITGIYTGLLGITYGLQAGNTPLPARGIIPGLFLGTSLVFAALYMAYIRGYGKARRLLPSGLGGDEVVQARLVTFFDWTFSGVLRRAWALRLSVVSLAVALTLLPIPFLDISGRALAWITGIAAGVVLLAAAAEGIYWFVQSRKQPPGNEVPGPVPGPLAAR